MATIDSKKILFGAAVIIVILLGFYFSNQYTSAHQQITAFGEQRGAVMGDYVDVVIGFSPETLKNPIPTCSQYSKFMGYIGLDTRQMSISQLQDALTLWNSCHYDPTATQYTMDSNFSDAISQLVGINSKINDPKVSAITTQIADDWRKIETLESQKTDLLAKAVDDQQTYWQAELDYKQGNNSFEQRQSTFDTLNSQENQDSQTIDQLKSQMKDLSTSEQDLWSEFMAQTGYQDSTASSTSSH